MRSNGARFADLAGIPAPPELQRESEAEYGPTEVGLMRAFNERIAGRSDINRFGWLLARSAARAESGLRPEEADAILGAYADSNEKVLARVPVEERVDGYFDESRVAASAELPYTEDGLWAFTEELAAHASLLNRQLHRLKRDL